MGDRIKRALFILTRLYHNQAGNTLAIVAAAVLPLAALIGGGVDMSRAYMAKARLQQACDAAALAGRRAMTTSAMTSDNITEARKFFDFNFPQNSFQTDSFTPNIRSDPAETTTVLVSASTRIPTTLMRIFRYEYIDLAVNCSSRFDIGNTDIMLVLDTTGSMSYSISDGNGGTTTRIAALRQAVKDFYDTLGPGSDTTGRIRYGFVPYSSTVNVGYLLPSSYLVGGTSGESWNYQTRRRIPAGYSNSSNNGNWTLVSGTISNWSTYSTTQVSSSSACVAPADTVSTTTGSPTSSTSTSSDEVITTTTATTRVTNGFDYSASFTQDPQVCTGRGWSRVCTQPSSGTCTISRRSYNNYTETKTDTATQTPQYSWQYGPYPLDVSGYITGNAVANPTYHSSSTTDANGNSLPSTSTWAGCIEERATDSSINASSSVSSIPSGAYDLNIDYAPNDTTTKWRPLWPDVEFTRGGSWLNTSSRISGGWNACPSRARKLASYANRTDTPTGQTSSFNSYVDALVPVGGTYHDIGMIWGARLLSSTGIFGSENSTAPNGFNISRHIVFMTDGDMSAYQGVYGAWGYQLLDGRVAATNTSDVNLTAIHNRRLEMLCNAVKGKGITIWVIGFRNQSEGEIQAPLQGCASSANHWTMAYNAAALSQKFKDIAKNIGGLRLSQ